MAGAATFGVAACTQVDVGRPEAVPSGTPDTALESTLRSTVAQPTTSSSPPTATAQPAPGIMTTQRTPVPADTVTCGPEARPPVSVVAEIDDPTAPRVTVGVPDGWSFTAGGGDGSGPTGDVAVTMQGPDGMTAAVTIAPTELDPEAAFRDYTDGVMARSAMSSVSILPAELCEYSGQELTGVWSSGAGGPDDSIEFVDRIVHVWTDADDYLVAVHVEGPAATDVTTVGSTITDDIEVTMP